MVPRARSKQWSIGPQILGCLLAVALAACGAADAPGIQTQFSDSAGVTIAESLGFPELGAGGWALDPTPTLSIGTLDGDSLYQLFRVTGSVELSDGRIAVTDNGTRQLRIFAPDGTFLASFGREGEGPGEFRNIQVMGTVGSDTLVVLDGRQRRTSRFHPDLGFLGQAVLPEEAGVAMHSNGMFGDGSIVFGGGVNFGAGGESPRAMARGNRLVLGTRDRYEIDVFDPSGGLVKIIRVQTSPVAVTDAHLDGLRRGGRSRDPALPFNGQPGAGHRKGLRAGRLRGRSGRGVCPVVSADQGRLTDPSARPGPPRPPFN